MTPLYFTLVFVVGIIILCVVSKIETVLEEREYNDDIYGC
jgi:hypothetical protein